MRNIFSIVFVLFIGLIPIDLASAARPNQKRDNADYVVSSIVKAVYLRDSEVYEYFIVELRVEGVENSSGLKKGDIFRVFCYHRKAGKGGIWDTAGHKAVPREGQRIRAFVNEGRGHHEGVYPDWFDVLPAGKK